MKSITKHIPNLFTLANLCCGVLAIILFMKHSFHDSVYYFSSLEKLHEETGACFGPDFEYLLWGIYLILLATIFDFLDGLAAKLLKAQSPIGAQLDSLADMVTFGVAPGILIYAYFNHEYIAYLSFLIPVFSALRLAKFNVDTEQTDYFKGIPTPANAIFWIGIVLAMLNGVDIHPVLIAVLIVGMSLLMMGNLKMISFKFKNLGIAGDNIYRYGLIAGTVLLTITCTLLGNFFLAIPLVIILYIILSIPFHYSKTKNA